MGWGAILAIVAIALISSAASEYLTWYAVYSKESYTKLKAEQDRLAQKVSKLEIEATTKPSTTTKSKLKEAKADVDRRSRSMQPMQLTATAISGVISMVTFWAVNSLFEGVAVARLPFVPVSIFNALAQIGLDETVRQADPRLASAVFIYALCLASIKVCVQRFMSLSPRDTGKSFFEMMEEHVDKDKPKS